MICLSNHADIIVEAIEAQGSEVTFLRLHSKVSGENPKLSDIFQL